ncbi:glycosyltransferase [soil metagenome]
MTGRPLRTAVITIVAGRREHLERQGRALAASVPLPDDYLIVHMDEPGAAAVETAATLHPEHLSVTPSTGTDAGLPLAAARNRGARRALELGAEVLVFLDVDCLPTPGLVDRYADALGREPHAIVSGAVGYLPQQTEYDRPERFGEIGHFHHFRPRIADGALAKADPRLFWSLSFALTAETWRLTGGFDERYVGYGAEDTDFALSAVERGIELLWAGGAEAFHQFHETEDPPVQHLDSILRNGALFAERWGFWPMGGWLEAFGERGLVGREAATGNWVRTAEGAVA